MNMSQSRKSKQAKGDDRHHAELARLKALLRGYHPDSRPMAEMLIGPGAHPAVRCPSYTATPVSLATFSRTYSLTASGADQQFAMYARPTINDFFSMKGGTTAQAVDQLKVVLEVTPNGGKAQLSDLPGGVAADQKFLGEQLIPIVNGGVRMNWTSTKVGTLNFLNLRNPTSSQTLVKVTSWHSGGSSAFTYNMFPNSEQLVTALATAGVNTWQGLEISVASVSGSFFGPGGTGSVTVEFLDVDATSISMTEFAQPLIADRWVDTNNYVQFYRVTALSMLASYRGNMLENAGMIAGARVPSHWRPNGATMYESLCRLPPSDFHKNPLQEGAYVWRLPYDLQEWEFIPVNRDPEVLTNLVIAGYFGDADAGLDITVTAVVEFYSPLQLFERNPCPAFTDAYELALRSLLELPPATCNPAHDKLVRLLKSGAAGAAKALRLSAAFARAHPELIQAAVNALSALAVV